MIEPRLFACSGIKVAADDPLRHGRRLIDLDSVGENANVNIRFENVAKVFHRHLSPRLVDLLEIASYTFSADCATRRAQEADEGVRLEYADSKLEVIGGLDSSSGPAAHFRESHCEKILGYAFH
jgi:hypothetical protein